MSYPLHPENNNLKKYYLHCKYKLDKSLMSNTTSFATKYRPVEGMKDAEWQIRITTSHFGYYQPARFWGIYLDVKSTVPIKYEGSFEIASEENSVLKQFHGNTNMSSTIGISDFIDHNFLFGKKQKFFVDQKTALYVNATFSFTTKEHQNLHGITKMIQSSEWSKRFRNHGEKNFKFIVGNKSIEVHKFFLTLESTVLSAMLENTNFKETQSGEMKIDGFKFETIKAVVDFCYGEDISSFMESTENAIDLLMFAEMYDMDNLKNTFSEYYSTKLTKENVADIYKVSRETNAPKLRGVCFDFIYSIPKSERTAFVQANLDPAIHDLF